MPQKKAKLIHLCSESAAGATVFSYYGDVRLPYGKTFQYQMCENFSDPNRAAIITVRSILSDERSERQRIKRDVSLLIKVAKLFCERKIFHNFSSSAVRRKKSN